MGYAWNAPRWFNEIKLIIALTGFEIFTEASTGCPQQLRFARNLATASVVAFFLNPVVIQKDDFLFFVVLNLCDVIKNIF